MVKLLACEQGIWCSNLGLATSISEDGHLLLPSRNVTEILLKQNPQRTQFILSSVVGS